LIYGRNAGLSPSELRTPMPKLRIMLLARAEQASTQLMQQIDSDLAIERQAILAGRQFSRRRFPPD
jgi:hypothetical protein